MEQKVEQQVQFSWKKRIKYLQMATFVGIIVIYFLYGYFIQVKSKFDSLQNTLQQQEIKLTKIKEQQSNIKLTTERIKGILANKKSFISAYNNCYPLYTLKDYVLSGTNMVSSLKSCIYNKGFNKPYIKNMTDEDIEKIAIGLGVLRLNNSKLSFPETDILYSLDKNVFLDNLEDMVSMVSFGLPKVENKQLNLYSVNISFKMKANYSIFKNSLSRLQNQLFSDKNVYYSVQNVSSLDIVNNTLQDILVQAKVYFIK